jgi:hypothetical protein
MIAPNFFAHKTPFQCRQTRTSVQPRQEYSLIEYYAKSEEYYGKIDERIME